MQTVDPPQPSINFHFSILPRTITTLALATLLACSPGSFVDAAFSSRSPQRPAHKPNPPAAPKALPAPFRVGEKLTYRVSWASFATAASAELTIPERRDVYGWQTWHFRASAHTASSVRTLFPIDDQFDSYSDVAGFDSRLYQDYLNEMGRKQDQQWRLVPEGQQKRVPGAAVIVLPGTRDPLGMLYSLRCVDWQHTPEIRVPVYDGRRLYEVRAKMDSPSETVEVPAGKVSALRVAVHVFQHNAQVSGTDFMMWIAGDPARTPVLMRAELPFGSLRVELTSSLRF